MQLKIIWRNDHLVAIDKPSGFFSHAPEDKSISYSFHWDVPTILSRQLGCPVFPLHRLDRATSGLMLLSLDREKNSFYQQQFQKNIVQKKYLCLVRGLVKEDSVIKTPLSGSGLDAFLDCETHIQPIFSKLCFPQQNLCDPHMTLLWAIPKTGRYHQIRRHLAKNATPIAGDSEHGDKKWNRRLYLHLQKQLHLRSMQLEIMSIQGDPILLQAKWGRHWHRAFDFMGFCPQIVLL